MMDPNEALKELRRILALYDNDQPPRKVEDALWDFQAMKESLAALDQWLSKGGFLPDEWNRDKFTHVAYVEGALQ